MDLINIPVIDKDLYNDLILDILNKNIIKINEVKNIVKFLTKDTLNKIQHLFNASNFDLI